MIDTEKRVVYKAFGLHITSVIPLPELPSSSEQPGLVDIEIERSDLTKLWNELAETNKKMLVQNQSFMFRIEGSATFLVQDGKKIIVSPVYGANEDKIRLYILGSCMGALLLQRGILPLHGSAVAINGKTYAFIGESGAGKSTLASALLNRGIQFLSDDVIAVSFCNQIPIVTPSYPQQKLWQESLDGFGIKATTYRPLYERENKYAVPVSSQFVREPLPLAGVFELVKTDHEHIGIQRIEKLERLSTLFQHTYRNFLIPKMGLTEWHFNCSLLLASHVSCYRLERSISGFSAFELADLMLTTIEKDEIG